MTPAFSGLLIARASATRAAAGRAIWLPSWCWPSASGAELVLAGAAPDLVAHVTPGPDGQSEGRGAAPPTTGMIHQAHVTTSAMGWLRQTPPGVHHPYDGAGGSPQVDKVLLLVVEQVPLDDHPLNGFQGSLLVRAQVLGSAQGRQGLLHDLEGRTQTASRIRDPGSRCGALGISRATMMVAHGEPERCERKGKNGECGYPKSWVSPLPPQPPRHCNLSRPDWTGQQRTYHGPMGIS